MRRMTVRALCALLLAAVLSAAFSTAAMAYTIDEATLDMEYYSQLQGKDAFINVYNWGEYISTGEDDTLNVNKEFERITGIKVNYTTFAHNEELYAKLKSGGARYDVIIPSDYMIARMIHEDMLQELNFENIPNYVNIDDSYRNPSYDPENRYTVPYTWGMVGIIYNTDFMQDEVDSWDVLWDETYAGDILMFSNPRDAFGITLKRLGYHINSENPEELQEAAEALKAQKPLVQAYVMDEIFDKMQAGEAILAPYYVGDYFLMAEENEALAFAYPKEGTNIFVDALCIPKNCQNQLAAEMYINFLNEGEVAAQNIEYIGYSTPNKAAFALLDEEITSDPIRYPDVSVVENAEYYNHLGSEANDMLDRLWTEVLSQDTAYNRWIMPLFVFAALAASVLINVMRRMRQKRRH